MIRILTIEFLNIILLLAFFYNDKILLKIWWCALTILAPCSVCRELKNAAFNRICSFIIFFNKVCHWAGPELDEEANPHPLFIFI
jgi:hypothetical protein